MPEARNQVFLRAEVPSSSAEACPPGDLQTCDEGLASWLRATESSQVGPLPPSGGWDHFLEMGYEAGLSGLLLDRVTRLCLPVPERIRAKLRHQAMGIAAGNLHRTGELERVLLAFNRANVEVMLLKGAALNLTVYTRPDLRGMSDVDLLIRPENASRAMAVLTGIGCRRGAALLNEDFFPKYYYEVEFLTDSPNPLRIDLHVRPFRPLRFTRVIPDSALWDNARTVQVGQAVAIIPSSEIMLVHLATHAAFHGCSRLLWLYDLKQLTSAAWDEIDWAKVTDRAREWKLSRAVLMAFERAMAYFGEVCPLPVIVELKSHKASWCDRLTLAQAPRDAAAPIAHVAVDLLCTPGIMFRLGYLRSLLVPGQAHLAQIYPYRHPGWMLGAHLWRALRAIGRPLGSVFGRINSIKT